MNDSIKIHPTGPVRRTIRPPGSKSITNRALVARVGRRRIAVGRARWIAKNPRHARIARPTGRRRATRSGHGYSPRRRLRRAVAGRPRRPLHGQQRNHRAFSDGRARARAGRLSARRDAAHAQRPIGDLLDALRQLGGEAVSESPGGCPPVVVHGRGLHGGGPQSPATSPANSSAGCSWPPRMPTRTWN